MSVSIAAIKGFSLMETCFALFLFALAIKALVGYQQALGEGFIRYQQQQQLWRVALEQLEPQAPSVIPPWQVQHEQKSQGTCTHITVIVTNPAGRPGTMSRLQCH